jgi:hypothetical protein
MSDRPIIFSAPMVLALLAGRKTQTRRVLKPQPIGEVYRTSAGETLQRFGVHGATSGVVPVRFAVGDRLYVRENIIKTVNGIVYAADVGDAFAGAKPKITPCIHMPRTASRMTLIVTEVRVEQLQDISEADALAEGARCAPGGWLSHMDGQSAPSAKGSFALLWKSINGPETWLANPWVVAVSFDVHQCNIDQLAPADLLEIAGAA